MDWRTLLGFKAPGVNVSMSQGEAPPGAWQAHVGGGHRKKPDPNLINHADLQPHLGPIYSHMPSREEAQVVIDKAEKLAEHTADIEHETHHGETPDTKVSEAAYEEQKRIKMEQIVRGGAFHE